MGEKMIPLSVPNFIGRELDYVTNAIKTEWVSTGGSYIDLFEKKIAEYVGTIGAVSCQNGTAGIHMALMLMGVTREQFVIVPTLTFIAAVNPVRYLGAEPIFLDCDDSLCLDPFKLEKFCKEECKVENDKLIHKASQKEIPCIVVVHVFGNMADMESIMDIASTYHLKVVEDATEALGTYYTQGKYQGKFAGTIGDIGIYSFNGNKIITTGGGGMLVSDEKEILKKAKHMTTQAKSDELYYEHDEVGYNYRMTNIQAALGVAQLENLERFIQIKRDNFNYYRKQMADNKNYEFLLFSDKVRANCWFYSLYLKDITNDNRDRFIQYLLEKGIQVRPIWGLIHEQKPYLNSLEYQIEKASEYRKRIINIPCSTKLTEKEIDIIINVINEYRGG